eukprot:CAMPEP_0201480592 /NCGR_PEP_ID=MMETSP0151_2-20130828/5049_1 /ASSEMBLY_ACC=CAM_ASM_000257 /TAXON_ID=200890 /ORGANISM="Paramoeba atlantica, Strain 621/1 / CCAP 1560/9" /LENGTH=345 /DNA_ID=CAMNT_0047862499 /DNA_START=148 /DNA_END=1185 /DNA_ORIENTATION=-
MTEVGAFLRNLFQAETSVLIPGSGTYAMEATARQFCTNKKIVVIQNGYFGFRWSEILNQGKITSDATFLKAQKTGDATPVYRPYDIEQVRSHLKQHKPQVVVMSHTDTSTGLMVSNGYIQAVAEAAHAIGALVVLDGIASGCIWTPMIDLGLDVIITAPQKAFYAPASVGVVLLSKRARAEVDQAKSTSFTLDLKKWINVQEQYENGGFAYHTTLPTVGIEQFYKALRDLSDLGIARLHENQARLGANVRSYLEQKGLTSVADEGSASPTVLVFYCSNPANVVSSFKSHGYKIAGGFSFFLGEESKPTTFRIGLFGFDKLRDVVGTTRELEAVIDKVFPGNRASL